MNDMSIPKGVQPLDPERKASGLSTSVRAPYSAGALSTETRPYGQEPEDSDEINLMEYWRIVIKRRWTIISVFVFVFIVTLVGTLLATPIYRATTTLQIERDAIKVVDVGELERPEGQYSQDFYQTQYELLRSRALAKRVANQPGLAESPVVERMLTPSPLAKLVGLLLSPLARKAPQSAAAEPSADPRRDVFVGVVKGNLTVVPERNTRLVRVHFDSPDPRFSARVANAVGESFIAMNLERRIDASSYAKTYLEEGLQQLQIKLQDSERKLVEFAQKEGIVNIQDRDSLVSEQLGQINSALATAQDGRIKAESRYRQLGSVGGEGYPEVLQSEVIVKLKGILADLQTDYENKRSIFKPKYPLMQQLNKQIEETRNQIQAEISNIKAGIITEYEAAVSKEKLLRETLNSLKGEVLDLQGRSIQYTILKREVDTTRQLYDGLLQRYKEVGVAGGVGTNNISVVDPAEIPGGVFSPKLVFNLAVAALLGLILGGLLAFLLEHLDDSIKSPEDVERQLGLSVLGVIPVVRKGIPYAQLKDLRSAFSESYRSVRTALQFSTDSGVPKTLFITSATPSEGKSTTALALAYHFAQLKKRVLLIDGDLRNPSLHKLLKLKNRVGLSNCLVGASAMLDTLQMSEMQDVVCITSGPLPPNPTELLGGPRMFSLLKMGLDKFDQIIIDGPPVLGIADAPVLGNIAAGTLLVMESGSTRVGFTRSIIKRLLMSRTRLLGVVLTKFDSREAGYYGGSYYYGDYGYVYGGKSEKKALKRA